LKDIVDQRRRHPENDLITNLLAGEQQGHLLTEEELIGTCVFFLVAGHETTTDLIGNGMLALLQNPDQMVRLRDKPSLIGSAVEEFLRYDSPVQRIWRLATRDCEIDGKRVHSLILTNLISGEETTTTLLSELEDIFVWEQRSPVLRHRSLFRRCCGVYLF